MQSRAEVSGSACNGFPQAPPAAYKEVPASGLAATDGWKIAQPGDAMLHGKWWEIYNDPELNQLEEQLDINNQTIKQYFENFMAARTLIAQAHSRSCIRRFPFGLTSYSAVAISSSNLSNGTVSTRRVLRRQARALVLPVESAKLRLHRCRSTSAWEPDLLGQSAQYDSRISIRRAGERRVDLENERLTEQASLAVYFFEVRGQDALQALYDATVEADKKALDLTRSQYETGVGDQVSVVEAQNNLQNAQAAATSIAVNRALYEHAIAVLIGTNPSNFSIPVKSLAAEPPSVPVGVPSQLLERRPDIAAAERTMASANAQIGVATAAFYPTLTLSGDARGLRELDAEAPVRSWPSGFWSVGPSVSQTIFDAGLRRATVNQYIEIYNADVAGYRQTVLTAFQQVEDYLASLRIRSQQYLCSCSRERTWQHGGG